MAAGKNDSLFRAGHTPASLYRQKLNIITNNIYGADRDTLAVGTAMLRLWRSLAVDYDGAGPPDPLSNLDLKLVAGEPRRPRPAAAGLYLAEHRQQWAARRHRRLYQRPRPAVRQP